jgi:hypothetical protein
MAVVPRWRAACAACVLLLLLMARADAQSHGSARQLQEEAVPPVDGAARPLPAHTSVHKPLLPIEAHDLALFVLSFLVPSLAAGAGIGEEWQLRIPFEGPDSCQRM